MRTSKVVALLSLMAWAPTSAGAQVVRGEVLEELRGRPIDGAEVLLVDSAGRVVATTRAVDGGLYALAAPYGGVHVLLVTAEGYEPLQSPPISVDVGAEAVVDLHLLPRAVDIPGIEVVVDAFQRVRLDLANHGVRLDDLGNRFIPETELARRFGVRDVGAVMTTIPGVEIIRPENAGASGTDDYICVSQLRGRTGTGLSRCGLVVLDGLPIALSLAGQIPVEQLRAIVVLRPTEATLVYGTMGGGGAVLLFTKTGHMR